MMKTQYAFALMMLLLGGLAGCGRTHTPSSQYEADAMSLAIGIRYYERISGELPATEQGLRALLERPDDLPPEKEWVQILRYVPTDPWGNEYQYKNLGGVPPEFEIRSFGRDGVSSEHDVFRVFTAGVTIDSAAVR